MTEPMQKGSDLVGEMAGAGNTEHEPGAFRISLEPDDARASGVAMPGEPGMQGGNGHDSEPKMLRATEGRGRRALAHRLALANLGNEALNLLGTARLNV